MKELKVLYRAENKTTICKKFPVNRGGDFRHIRNGKFLKEFKGKRLSMHSGKKGRDYTPLFRFLLSRVGKPWDEVYSQVLPRIDTDEPVWWMVSTGVPDRSFVRLGECTYFSMLFVDEDGILRKVADDADILEQVNDVISCQCCTYTFNGAKLPIIQ